MEKPSLHIVKIGGNVLASEETLERVLNRFLDLAGKKILVHGGGRRASELSRRLGIEPRMHQGRRITDADALEVAVMVYAGLANKTLVAQLQGLGCNALGMSGADGNAILAEKRPVLPVDYGYVGNIQEVNTGLLANLLNEGITPVFCAITHDKSGQLLNTNADSIAAGLAAAMARDFDVTLSFCFEKPGVLRDADDDSTLIPHISRQDYLSFQDEGIIHSGMLPKLENAFRALEAGVSNVEICGPGAFGKDEGTLLSL